MHKEPEYLSPRGVEERFPISRWTVRQWAYTGRIASVKLGGPKGRLLIPISEIERVFRESLRPRVQTREG